MRTEFSAGELFTTLKHQTKIFLRDEIQLASAELSEKASFLGKRSLIVTIGGLAAFAGIIVFLGSLGMVIAFGFERAGVQPSLAAFLGLAIIGLVVIASGTAAALAAVKAIKHESFVPQRTMETLQHLSGTPSEPAASAKKENRATRSPAELEATLLRTEDAMAETLDELRDRVTLKSFRGKANLEIYEHPYRWGAIALTLGVAGGFLLERNLFPRKIP